MPCVKKNLHIFKTVDVSSLFEKIIDTPHKTQTPGQQRYVSWRNNNLVETRRVAGSDGLVAKLKGLVVPF